MRLCYHHHMGTGVQTRAEVDRLMNDTDPEVVHLLLDTGHLYWAGDDPLDMARAYADRIGHVHLKDIRQDVLDRCMGQKMSFLESMMEGSSPCRATGSSTSRRSSGRSRTPGTRAGCSGGRAGPAQGESTGVRHEGPLLPAGR